MDANVHQEFTGVSNHRILENLRSILLETRIAVWVRIPIIPGFNHSEEAIAAIGEFIHALPRPVEKVSLLPFHQFGAGKYAALGRPSRWAGQAPLSEENVTGFKRWLEGSNLKVDIGR
jgi:pyruvate formate lyase activating enzyme